MTAISSSTYGMPEVASAKPRRLALFGVDFAKAKGHSRFFRRSANTALFIAAGIGASAFAEESPIANADVIKAYVSWSGSDTAPYDSWEKATSDILSAYATGASEIIVGDGEFTHPGLTIDRSVSIHSLNGPEKTVLKLPAGKSMHFNVDNNAANAETLIAGFTLNGASGAFIKEGFFALGTGMISNCVMSGSVASWYRYGAKLFGNGAAVDCEFDGSSIANALDIPSDCGFYLLRLEGSAVADRCQIHDYHVQTTSAAAYEFSPIVLDGADTVLRNALIYNCSTRRTGGGPAYYANMGGGAVRLLNGTIENCTVVNCNASGNGGGIWASTANGKIINTIAWNNACHGTGADIYAPSLSDDKVTYCCAGDFGNESAVKTGIGCVAFNPAFRDPENDDYRLSGSSVACIDKGGATEASQVAGATDLDGSPRLDSKTGTIDMGCYEFDQSNAGTPLAAVFRVIDPGTVGAHEVTFEALVAGDAEGLEYCWNFGDGATTSTNLTVSHVYQPGRFEPFLALTNGVGETTNVQCCASILVLPQIAYVAVDGSETYPYDTWEKATTNLAAAIEVGSPEVLVGDGTFVNTVYEHVIDRSLVLRSVNGPGKTILKRHPSKGRHFRVSDNANTKSTLIAGFTCYGAKGGFNTDGFFQIAGGVVSNCVFTGDMAGGYAAFCHLYGHGTAVDCEFDGSEGGTLYCPEDGSMYMLKLEGHAVADRCHVHDMHITSSDAANSRQKFSPVQVNGANAVFRNSLVRNCSSRRQAGGTDYVAALSGGGICVIAGTVANCTVVNCSSSGNGGGIWARSSDGKIINTIAWNNTCSGADGKDIHAPSLAAEKVTCCCASDFGNDAAVKTGIGCISADPRFVSPARGDFRLKSGSPCREAGDSSYWTDIGSVFDLLGNPRLLHSRVDMGCYETKRLGFSLILR